jgi:hypothetical protein
MGHGGIEYSMPDEPSGGMNESRPTGRNYPLERAITVTISSTQ